MSKFKILFLLFFGAGVYFQVSVLGNFIIKTQFVSDVITFLSIIFGFYVTSFAIFTTSRYVSELYLVDDKLKRSLTLLDSLIRSYRFGLISLLFTVLYFFIILFIITQRSSDQILLKEFIALPIMPLTLFNFIYGYKMLDNLIKIVTQEAKRNSRSKNDM